ncbi:hypothetical protein [Kitasatospora sp. NPDC058046]|uniref:hypothetical protein n=1 Tax=Kitasatospora sp. NPDC058046 TaxID=3346312 RepID=UPI0036D800DB
MSTGRPDASSITDDQLDALYAERDRYREENGAFADRVDALTAVARSNRSAHRVLLAELTAQCAELRRANERAARLGAAWTSARRRSVSWQTLYRSLAAERAQRLGNGPWVPLAGHQASLRRVHARRNAVETAVRTALAEIRSTRGLLGQVVADQIEAALNAASIPNA